MPLYRAAILMLVIPLTACTHLNIDQPSNGAHIVCGPNSTEVSWGTDLQSGFSVKQDGTDITQQFAMDSANRKATATITYLEGNHSLRASGTFYCWYCSGSGAALAESSNFSAVCRKK
jgi:hypothetical protein